MVILSVPAVRSLTLPGGYTSHDLTHHVIRQISMHKLLSEGQFPPRWSSELNNGFGYPVFLFNYPLPALLGEIFHLTGFGFVDSVKGVLFLSLVLSVLGMYLFIKAWLKDSMAAFLASMFYLYAPIRFIHTYVSASVGSALAMAVIPFIFLSLVKKNYLMGSLSLALLILAHNVTALIFTPLILAFAFVFVRRREVIWMFLLGAGLSAWFWIPALYETQYIRYSQVVGKVYLDQFPSINQLIYSPWGFGLSHPQEEGGMSYQIGLIHLLVVLLSLLLIKTKSSLFALSFFTLSIFLMLKISLPVWDNTPLALVQYPFRLLAISVFTASVLAALLVKQRKIFILLLILLLYANRNHLGINQIFDPGEKYYLDQKTTTATHGEHLPKWGRAMSEPSGSKYLVLRGQGEVQITEDKSHRVTARVIAETPIALRFNQFYFPGWEFEVNGQRAAFNYLQKGENYGLPVIEIPAGMSTISAQFNNTPDRELAGAIGLASVILWLIFLCRLSIRR